MKTVMRRKKMRGSKRRKSNYTKYKRAAAKRRVRVIKLPAQTISPKYDWRFWGKIPASNTTAWEICQRGHWDRLVRCNPPFTVSWKYVNNAHCFNRAGGGKEKEKR
ncbi:MAG TPA: hypothetical protein VH985_04230 [Candidatus Binatia bacterium]